MLHRDYDGTLPCASMGSRQTLGWLAPMRIGSVRAPAVCIKACEDTIVSNIPTLGVVYAVTLQGEFATALGDIWRHPLIAGELVHRYSLVKIG
jgi:hypothetical protein